jgi:hypothetical protein
MLTIRRTQNNMAIDKLIEGAHIVRYIKAQRIEWLGHIQRMDQARPTRKLLDWKPMGTRPVGRHKELNGWGISKEWTKQDQLGSY